MVIYVFRCLIKSRGGPADFYRKGGQFTYCWELSAQGAGQRPVTRVTTGRMW